MGEVEEEAEGRWQSMGEVIRVRKGLQWKQGDCAEVDDWGGKIQGRLSWVVQGFKV